MNTIEMIMRQTDYDEKTTRDKLKEHNNDIKNVVREFLGIQKETNPTPAVKTTAQQEIYKQFRNFL
jgi:hypothetical protein